MQAHRIASVVSTEGTLHLSGLLFKEAAEIEVIVLPMAEALPAPSESESDTVEDILARMRGRVTRYNRPHDPAWESGEGDMLRPGPEASS